MRAATTVALGVVVATLLGGCGTFYRHEVITDEYVLYGDDVRDLEATAAFVERVIRTYRTEFPVHAAAIRPPWIIYDRDELSREQIFTGETRQEGYYLPFFRLIHLSPQHDPDDDENRHTVILHEFAHHFLVSAFPRSRNIYWLNEGFACALEVSFFDDHGRLVMPLYHLTLHEHARRALLELGEEGFLAELEALIGGSWFRFHQHGDKTRHYAMAWALVHQLLREREGSLETRLAAILDLSDAELRRAMQRLLRWLLTEPDVLLAGCAQRPALRLWALERWLEVSNPDGVQFLAHLLPLIEHSSDLELRIRALAVLTRALNLRMRKLSARRLRSVRSLVLEALRNGNADERLAVLTNLRPTGKHPVYLRPLVHLLADEHPEVRIEAAAALARLTPKPTFTRPAFWRSARREQRDAEVEEWRRWLVAAGL